MFAGGAYSRYSALENPYIVRETTDAGSKSQAQVLADIARQRKKKALEAGKLKNANANVEVLTKQVNSDQFLYTKHPEYQRERRRELRHQTERAATAQNRAVHYNAKIEKKTDQIKTK
jgi:hypothetical protein